MLRLVNPMSPFRPLLALATVVLAAGCSDSTPTAPVDTFGGSATSLSVDVTMPSTAYIPNHIDIAQGGVVRFIFAGLPHDVRFGGNPSAPQDILVTSNTTVSRTFANTGTFTFLCTLHANMTGTVVVH
jgi:plastocyanin